MYRDPPTYIHLTYINAPPNDSIRSCQVYTKLNVFLALYTTDRVGQVGGWTAIELASIWLENL